MVRKLLTVLVAGLAAATTAAAAAVTLDAPAVRPGTMKMPKASPPLMTIAGIVAGSSDFTLLLASLKATDLVDTFADAGASFTVFAPTDAAFVKLAVTLGYTGSSKTGALDFILAALTTLGNGDPVPLLTTILKLHVTAGAVDAAALVAAGGYTPLEGMRVLLAADGKSLIDFAPAVADPMLVTTDIKASNGIVHAISGVLLPIPIGGGAAAPASATTPAMTKTPTVTKAPTVPVTVVVPAPPTVVPVPTPDMPALQTIAEIAVATPELSLLVRALTAADLVGVVANASASLTVFAPTNTAFLRLARTLGYAGTDGDAAYAFVVAALTRLGGGDPIPLLTRILTYHVLPGVQRSTAIVGAGPLTTVQGSQLAVRSNLEVVDLAPSVRNAKIVMADVAASNGVVHLVDRVLLPLPICPASGAAFCARRGAVLDAARCRCVRRKVVRRRH